MTRLEIINELTKAGCAVVGAEWNADTLLEDAHHKWIRAGSPPYAVVIIDRNLGTGTERTIIETCPELE